MPAKYADLGKKANDLFSKGYEHGKYKVEVGSKAEGFEFTTKGHQDAAKGTISSSHETKFSCPFTKMAIKTTFEPGQDSFGVEAENSNLVKNLKITGIGAFPLNGCPIPEFKKLKAAWGNDKLNINMDTNLKNSLNIDAVFATPTCNFGTKLSANPKSMALASREIALNIQKGSIDYTFRTALNNDFNVLIHNQVSATTGVAISSTYNSKATSLALATKMAGACGSSNQFKICNNGTVALSHITPLKSGAELTISGEFDATNLTAGGHKLGAGLKFTL